MPKIYLRKYFDAKTGPHLIPSFTGKNSTLQVSKDAAHQNWKTKVQAAKVPVAAIEKQNDAKKLLLDAKKEKGQQNMSVARTKAAEINKKKRKASAVKLG